jgi:2-keto-4-pentenoate hydratase/2-oxohepta-3-ene-1,7-dioic acid hydratase in catechol pathway
MKLIRFGEKDKEKPGLESEGIRYDVSSIIGDYDEDFFAQGGLEKLRDRFHTSLPVVSGEVRLGPPIKRPGKLVCIGLNYRKHAAESGMEVPEEPVVFFKATSAISGPHDPIVIPRGSQKTDWEVELAVVIGKRALYISEEDAMDYIAGYMVHNDVSERAFQLERGGQWVKGKSCDTFAPVGPYLVTKDEIPDPNHLRLWLTLNGQKMQDGNTNDFIWKVQYVVAYLSQFMSLMPGDVISTGTPMGVGLGMDPPVYLKAGDVIELEIEGLGRARQEAIDWS